MARKARQKSLYSTYWIEQYCSNTPFFCNDADRQYFLNCLKRSQQQYGFLLLGYRLEDQGYQLILYDNGNDITRIMRTLNIEYALKMQRETFKLKERFKSNIIADAPQLLEAIKKMTSDTEFNPFNSYSSLCNRESCIIDDDIAMAIFGHNREAYSAFIKKRISLLDDAIPSTPLEPNSQCEKQCIGNLDQALQHLSDQLEALGLTHEQMLAQKTIRNQLIWYYRKHTVATLKELGDLFGGMSESAISKIIRKHIASSKSENTL